MDSQRDIFVFMFWLSLHLQNNNTAVTSKRIMKHRTHMLFYSILTIPKLQRSDRGLYTCRVTSGEKTKQQEVPVTVYGEFFLWKSPDELVMSFTLMSFFRLWITDEGGECISQQSSSFTFLILYFLNFRPSIYPFEAQTRGCDGSSSGTEILPNLSQTKSVPCPWSHLVRDRFDAFPFRSEITPDSVWIQIVFPS